MKPQVIGFLGLGSYSTLFYIKELNALYNKINQGYSTCPFKMLNINFDEINNLLPNPSKKLDAIVKFSLDELIELGVNSILVPNITLHETIDRLNIETQMIHPVFITLDKIQQNDHKKVIVFGSKYTMESNYIRSIFEEKNIDVVVPSQEEIFFIDNVRKQVYQNLATKETLVEFQQIIEKYAENYAVIIACTELSVACENTKTNIFDMARIQIENAVSRC